MKPTSLNNEKYSQYFENKKHCQTFVYNADEVSLEALLDPSFRPMQRIEKPHHQSQQIYYGSERLPHRSSSTSVQPSRYERASFDPFTDLPAAQQFSTIPSRRRPHILSNSSIIHL
jgi:hypothetical protein